MMPDGLPEDLRKLLERPNRELSEVYAERYRGLVLFGSYARGEARGKDSDVDLLLLLAGEVEPWREYVRKVEPIKWPLSLGTCYPCFPSTSRIIGALGNLFS